MIAEMVGTTLEAVQAKLAQSPRETVPLKPVKTQSVSETTSIFLEGQPNALAIALIDGACAELLTHSDPALFHGGERAKHSRGRFQNYQNALSPTHQRCCKNLIPM